MNIAPISLRELLPQAPEGLAALRVSGLSADSRNVKPGDLFFARSGVSHRGVDFIAAAAANGAVLALADDSELSADEAAGHAVPVLRVTGLNTMIGTLASRFYGDPSHHLCVVGITGTNGKTSSAHYLAQALTGCGCRAALIGTVGNGFPGQLHEATHTTPDTISLHAELARLRAEGAQAVVMEVSSHALDQERVAGVRFAAAGYTNLSHDHLDYHGDMAAYAAAKARLFTDYGVPLQVLNADDAEGRSILSAELPPGVERLGYGLDANEAEVRAQAVQLGPKGLMFELLTPWGDVLVTAPLMGRFNVSNLLLVAAVLGGLGYELSHIAGALEHLVPVSGRMERIAPEGGPSVIVDYAHTPDALDKALSATREHLDPRGKLWVVFGCGGDRDRAKRAVMGKIAAQRADEIVLTSDNPRSENPGQIIAMIEEGAASAGARVEPDRARAIAMAVMQASPQDTILIAGKGHETYQEVMGVRHPFSDQQQVHEALVKRGSV